MGRIRVAVAALGPARGQVVGFATVTASHDEPELEDVFVDPRWRRRGVARRLVADLVMAARASGHRRLWVTGQSTRGGLLLCGGIRRNHRVAAELGLGLRMYLDLI